MKYLVVHIQGEKHSWISVTKSTLTLTDFQGWWFDFIFPFGGQHYHFLYSKTLSLSWVHFVCCQKYLYFYSFFYVFHFPQSCTSTLVWCLFHVAENTSHRNAKAAWQQASLWACWHHPLLWALIQLSTQCLKLHSLWAQKMNTRIHLCILLPCKQIALWMTNQSNNGVDSLHLDKLR